MKTQFSKNELKKILSNYDLGKLLESKTFGRGYVQTNVLLKTKKGKYVLRYYEYIFNRSKKYVLFEVNILHYFSEHKYPCAMPIRNIHGSFVGKHKRKYYALFEYIPGRHIKNVNNKQFREIIKHVAMLHRISLGYKPDYYEYREAHDIKFCRETAMVESKRYRNKIGKERYQYIRSRLKLLEFPNNVPKGVIHCDFDKANIKFKGNKITGILDFDDACYTHLIYDLGMVILYWAWFYPKKLEFEKAKKIIQIYNKYRKLTKTEKNHIYDALQLVMLLMMSWFLYDKWKGEDLFKTLKGMLDKLNKIGRKEFNKRLR